jgi:hypothetical protein
MITYDKNKITGHALETLNEFIKFADKVEVTPQFLVSLEDAKSGLYDLINKLKIENLDILQQIEHAQNVISGIEYIQKYIADKRKSYENNM